MKGLIVIDDFAAPTPALPAGELMALVPVANQPLWRHAAQTLRRSGAAELAIVAPSRCADVLRAAVEQFRTAGPPPIVIEAQSTSSLVSALAAADEFLEHHRFIVHRTNGIWASSVKPLRQALTSHSAATFFAQPFAAVRPGSTVAADHVSVAELQPRELAGVHVFGPDALQLLERLGVSDVTFLDDPAVSIELVHRQWFTCAGDPEDVLAVNRAALDDLHGDADGPHCPGSRLEGRVHIHPSARVSDSLVLGPVIVGASAHVEHALLGPYTAVGAGAVVENSEVLGSVLCKGAVVRDISTRLEASVVGPRAIVRGDFMLPRSLRVAVGHGATICLA